MILENLEAGSNIIYEASSNGSYIIDYPRYDAAKEKEKLEKQTKVA